MNHRKYYNLYFSFLLSGQMSFIITAINLYRLGGLTNMIENQLISWVASWIVAFPVVLIVAPITRKILDKFVK